MNTILKYFFTHFNSLQNVKPNPKVIHEINKLNRKERGELRSQLFERARLLESSKSPNQIIQWLEECFQIIEKYSFSYNRVFFSPGYGIKPRLKNYYAMQVYRLTCVFLL